MKTISIFISWVLLIAGWIIVHSFTKKRERDRELRETLRNHVKDLEHIREAAKQYHISATRDLDCEEEILWLIENVDLSLSILASKFKKTDWFFRVLKIKLNRVFKPKIPIRITPSVFNFDASLLTELRDAITSENFQTNNFKKQSRDSTLLRNIDTATIKFITALKTQI